MVITTKSEFFQVINRYGFIVFSYPLYMCDCAFIF